MDIRHRNMEHKNIKDWGGGVGRSRGSSRRAADMGERKPLKHTMSIIYRNGMTHIIG